MIWNERIIGLIQTNSKDISAKAGKRVKSLRNKYIH